ncbi:MAG: PIN domain-containing protein [Silvibacterium sp.]|nr:PIN domain-containing protein [Silvibacterium sp.]
MTAPVFVDTNVLIYSLDKTQPRKQPLAERWRAELWRSRRGRISYQVLQEFYANVATKWPAIKDQARAEIRDLLAWRPVPIDGPVIEQAWKLQDRYHLSFWDSLIIAAAKAASCRYLLTEDLQAGQDLSGVLVVNPFLQDPASPLPG